jgi:hypothetical protein
MGIRAIVEIGPESRDQITNFFAKMAITHPRKHIVMSVDRQGIVFTCANQKIICETDPSKQVVETITSPRY